MKTAIGKHVRRLARTSAITGALALGLVLSTFVFAPAAPASPTIASPAQGSVQPASIRISGAAPGATTVDVYEGASHLGSVNKSATASAWSLTVTLAAGNHTISAVGSTSTTDVSPPSEPVSFEVDSTKPAITVTTPKQNDVVANGAANMVSGSATDDRGLFAVKLDYWSLGKLVLRSLADCACGGTTSASWSHTPTLTPGYYTVVAYSIDAAANQSPSMSRDFLISSSAPPMPSVVPTVPGMPSPPVITAPSPGATVPGAGQPVKTSGRATPGTNVKIFEQSLGPIGTVRTDGKGYWSYTTYFRSGTYRVTAQAQNPSTGVLSNPAKIVSFQVDADRPNVAFLTQDQTIFLPLEPIKVEGRIFDNRRVASVRLEYWLLDSMMLREWANCVGCNSTDAIWNDTPNLQYPGTYSVVARGFDAAGNQSYSTTIDIIKVV